MSMVALVPTNKDVKIGFFHLCQLQGVKIYTSDGACRGQGTKAETHADWGAAVWSADESGLGAGVAFATARGFLGNAYANNLAEHIAIPNACLVRFVCRPQRCF